ncbi:MAG TPA: hypothetical protein VG733_15515 [Chthoniobacteraceae bacterium]|nr:hypothetical protein [Chthoniobacteraceae bacterium]
MNTGTENAGEKRRGHAGSVAATAIVAVAMVWLALPGFVAAAFSMESIYYGALVGWDKMPPDHPHTFKERAEWVLLAPSGWVAAHSDAMNRFYFWEYRMAGGRVWTF